MYQPTLGRFLSRDPLSANGVDVLTDTGFYSDRLAAMNADPWFYGGNWTQPYVYAGNNPVRYVDPSGLDWLDCMAECFRQRTVSNAGTAAFHCGNITANACYGRYPRGGLGGPRPGGGTGE
jgi:hypothetical protein